MREAELEKKLVERVKELGGEALKFVSPGNAGVPDRIILMRSGRIYFAEVKAPGECLRPLQRRRKKQLEQLGFKVFVVDSMKSLGGMINEIKNRGT